MDGSSGLNLPGGGGTFCRPTWEEIQQPLQYGFRELFLQAPSMMRGLVRPIKKSLKETRETIIYFSCRSSEETYRHVIETPCPRNPSEMAWDFAFLYRRLLLQKMKMAVNLFFRAGRPTPDAQHLLEMIFLAWYEAEGPVNTDPSKNLQSETQTADLLARRFYNTAQFMRENEESLRSVMGMVYSQTWQTGEFLVRNRFSAGPASKRPTPWVPN